MYKNYTRKWSIPTQVYRKILLIMRLTTVILIASLLQVSAATFGQRITIDKQNVALESVLKEIRKQSGYDFFYHGKIFSKNQQVSISLKNATVEEALKLLFANLPVKYQIQDKRVAIHAEEQNTLNKVLDLLAEIDVSGILIDEQGNRLPGATIRVKGTQITTITDANGSFLLRNVNENAIIEVSYIGYVTKEFKAKSNLGAIALVPTSANLLEVNVVSTGYQTLPKERATGAFGQIGKETLSRRPASNLSTALQGLVAGMQAKENADGSVNFIIRGSTSMYADRSPLVVIDGFPVSNSDFSSINPNDVESVTVLKDAAAASIWGARSANGVIVVTTKRGTAKQGLKVEANVFRRISKSPDLNQIMLAANSADHIAVEKMGFANNWFFGSSNYGGSFPSNLSYSMTLAQELLYANKNGKISAAVMNSKLDSLSLINNKSQISNELMRPAALSQYNVSLNDATEKTKTYASLLFEDNDTKFKGSGYNRFGINFNNEYRPASFITFNFGLYLQYRELQNSGATTAELQALSPYETLLNPDGGYSPNLAGQNREILSMLPLNLFPYPDWSYNLLREVRGRKLKTQEYSARIQTGFNLKLVKGLTFDTKLQYERGKIDVDNYYSDDTYLVRNMVNTYLEYNNTTKTVGKVYIPKGGIGQSNNTNSASYVFRNQLNFIKDLGTKHNINAIAGMEISQYRTDTRTNPWLYGYFPDKLQSSVPPYGYGSSVALLTHITGPAVTLVNPLTPNSGSAGNTTLGYNLDRYISYYGNASYTYDRKYTLSASIRTDASNFITKISSLRWEPLWSLGGLWNIKNEGFAQEINWIDRLTLRATYGRNGNVEKSSSTNTLLNVANSLNANTGTITATIADNGNPTLRWEKTTTTNIGTDFILFNGKLSGKLDLYRKVGSDITGLVALSSVTGTISQRFNNAGILNKGIEIELGTQLNLPLLPIRYTTSVNYAYNNNRVNSLYFPSLLAFNMLNSATAFVEGKPINPIYSYNYLGMVDGVPQLAGPGGVSYPMNTTTLAGLPGIPFLNYEGTNIPPHTLGWYNDFRFKGFQFSALFIGKFGGVYRNPTFNYESAFVGSSKTVLNRFAADVLAGSTTIPGFPKANETNQFRWDRYVTNLAGLVESSSYIECKELTLDYSIPAKKIQKLGFGNLKVFAQVRDLGLVWSNNERNYNPDWLPGSDRPLTSYTLGINLSL